MGTSRKKSPPFFAVIGIYVRCHVTCGLNDLGGENVNVTLKEKGRRFLFIPNLCIRSRSFCKAKSQTLAFSHGGRTLKT